jgi:hypothetical protein
MSTSLHSVFPLLRDRVETHYRIPVLIIDVLDPFAGDLDRAEIHLDYASADDLQVFTLAHLFGHTIQWSLSSHFWTLGGKAPGTYSEGDLAEVDAYERDASRYGISLLHEVGVDDLDGWLSDFSACDRATWRTSTARARSGRPRRSGRRGRLFSPLSRSRSSRPTGPSSGGMGW